MKCPPLAGEFDGREPEQTRNRNRRGTGTDADQHGGDNGVRRSIEIRTPFAEHLYR